MPTYMHILIRESGRDGEQTHKEIVIIIIFRWFSHGWGVMYTWSPGNISWFILHMGRTGIDIVAFVAHQHGWLVLPI
jgi:hypothetical protein